MYKKIRVLVVEDDDSLRDTMMSQLAKADFECWATSNGEMAESLCRDHAGKKSDFDVIICDQNMPKKNGSDLFKTLSDRQKGRFILWSGSGYDNHGIQCRTMAKDLSFEEILDIINDVVGQ